MNAEAVLDQVEETKEKSFNKPSYKLVRDTSSRDSYHPDSSFHPLAQRSQPYDWSQALRDTN